ncbi:phosphatase PAP2 family protein [Streptomyces djakartensis]|uniref:Membrane protein n=1 Tax=Streptomyces djakartensis TaxID=68193 RepID=A0ABQ3AJC1_9ACTN|nr:phosphatase PAP2 family protein [Streptomyces djakartensis]GGY50621.1 membrane protein [Streptomyces djakartensis]
MPNPGNQDLAGSTEQDARAAPASPTHPRPVALLVGLPALLFALITWQVVVDGPLVAADERLSRVLIEPDRFSELLADLGNVQVAVPVLAAALGQVALRTRHTARWWLPVAAATVLIALVPALIIPLKDLTDRPGTPAVPPGNGYYPSGHTATAAVAYGCATLLLLSLLRTALARRALVTGCAVLVLGTSFGLVRRGYHWPLDVVASWCLCAVLLSSLWLLLRRTTAPAPPG